ncbi:hypothetical protein Ancab_024861, partial [Ancistrocladus abbreviatus]
VSSHSCHKLPRRRRHATKGKERSTSLIAALQYTLNDTEYTIFPELKRKRFNIINPEIDNMEMSESDSTYPRRISGKTAVWASIATVAIGGPFLVVTGFSLMASVTLLLIASPLLLIFSPPLLFGGFVLGAGIAGFVAAAVMALAGLSILGWMFRRVRGQRAGNMEWPTRWEKVEKKGKEWADYLPLQQKVDGKLNG